MIEPEDIVSREWADWYRLTPLERLRETEKLWAHYLFIGGSLDPQPDTQSPFDDAGAPRSRPVDGWSGLRFILYGAAQFSRDVDLAILAGAENLVRLQAALNELQAAVVAA